MGLVLYKEPGQESKHPLPDNLLDQFEHIYTIRLPTLPKSLNFSRSLSSVFFFFFSSVLATSASYSTRRRVTMEAVDSKIDEGQDVASQHPHSSATAESTQQNSQRVSVDQLPRLGELDDEEKLQWHDRTGWRFIGPCTPA